MICESKKSPIEIQFFLILQRGLVVVNQQKSMDIKIRVYAPGFINHDAIDQDGFINLEEGDSLGVLYRKLKVPLPLRPILVCSVNYEKAKLNIKLKDGDVVSFLFPISGG